ncbi:MAG TPA: PAS domain-containing protein [Coleofasciculaceae cyanobacterium]
MGSEPGKGIERQLLKEMNLEHSIETARLKALQPYQILDTQPEPCLDDLASLIAQICATPVAFITLIDETQQWIKSKIGSEAQPALLEAGFCSAVVQTGQTLVIADTSNDERFAYRPVGVSEPHVGFYAGTPLTTQNGQIVGTLCVIDFVPRDLDAVQLNALEVLGRQVVAQLELKRSPFERQQTGADRDRFFDLAADMLAIVGFDGYFKWLSPTWEQTLGWTSEELMAQPYLEFVHPDDRPATAAEVQKTIAAQTTSVYENRYRCKEGSYRWLSWKTEPFAEEQRIYGRAIDITDEKQVEAALRDSEAKFRTIADTMPQIVWSTTADGYHDYFNQRWYDYTGMIRGGDQGWNWKDYLYPDDYQRTLEIWQYCLKTGEPYEVEYRFRRASDGAFRWFIGRALPIYNDQGEITRWFGTCTDVNDQWQLLEQQAQLLERERSARTEAERVSRMKDEFLATLSHELRTPLNAILGWSQLLRRGGLTAERMTQGLNTIDRNVRIQSQLIEDLLDMSRIISGKIRLDVQRIDLPAVIEAALETVRLAAEAKEIRLQKVLDSQAGIVSGDPARLQQVVWNLLSNAIKFTPKGGRVLIVLERVESHIEISVIDTGKGIEPDFLPYVFERFRQADASITRQQGGLGLGLSIVRSLIELHGGTVRAESLGAGKGATFMVALPLMAVHADRPSESPVSEGAHHLGDAGWNDPDSPSLRGVKVLVTDDELDARELVQFILEQVGAAVVTANSSQQALTLLKVENPDVLVSDIGMPGVDGYQLIRQVRSLPPEQGGKIPAVALTAYARTEDRKLALLSGYQMHIAKPVEPSELIAIVSSLTSLMQRKGSG